VKNNNSVNEKINDRGLAWFTFAEVRFCKESYKEPRRTNDEKLFLISDGIEA